LLTVGSANTEIAGVREQFKNEIKLLAAKLKIMEAELSQTQRKLAAKVFAAYFANLLTLLGARQ
jgi:hypothetical protein